VQRRCNIRVDLLLIYPLLLGATLGVFAPSQSAPAAARAVTATELNAARRPAPTRPANQRLRNLARA